MAESLLHKAQSGIAGEFLAAGELARRGFNVTLTFGNTKAIDLLIEKEGKLFPVQVKTIQRRKSICWNISLSRIEGNHLCYILVNLNVDTLESPEFYILTEEEVRGNFKPTKSGRDYLDYTAANRMSFLNRWDKIGK